MSLEGFRQVVDLNLTGTLLPSLVFGEAIVQAVDGAIVNVSSMAAERALTRAAGRLRRGEIGAIRVNTIAPGFFIGEQNRDLLLEPDGSPTRRGQSVLAHTPVGRFGETADLMARWCGWALTVPAVGSAVFPAGPGCFPTPG